MNPANPAMYTRFRPRMSDKCPMGNNSAETVSVSPNTTHWTEGRSAWKYEAMLGKAMMIMPLLLTTAMNVRWLAPTMVIWAVGNGF